jgi:Apea-like HEPN
MLGFSTWEKKLGAAPGPTEKLPPADWRYFVIKYEGTNAEVEDLQAASCLAPVELEIAFTLIWVNSESNPPGMAWHPARLFHTLETARFSDAFFSKVTSADIEQLRSTYTLFRNSGGQTRQMITQLMGLKGFPYDSPLRFLGYFAILESILTHAPKPEDRYDSITRQVKKKLALLDARWSPKIDYSPFGGAKPEKVWGTMYEYRSAIAHGGTADFAPDLRLLKGPAEALTLLKQTVKAVIRQALIEPELLRDLREC